jgi:hypothetical protein
LNVLYFFCLCNSLAKASTYMLNGSCKSWHLCLCSRFYEKIFQFFSIQLITVGLSYMICIKLRHIPFV